MGDDDVDNKETTCNIIHNISGHITQIVRFKIVVIVMILGMSLIICLKCPFFKKLFLDIIW